MIKWILLLGLALVAVGEANTFSVISFVRNDLFGYSIVFDNIDPILTIDKSKLIYTCGAGTVLDFVVGTAGASAMLLRTDTACAGGDIRLASLVSGAVVTATRSLQPFNLSLADGIVRTNPTQVVARTDGVVLFEFPQSIVSFESQRYLLYFQCSSGTADAALSGQILPQSSRYLLVRHTPCSSYAGSATILVKLVSFNLLFQDATRSDYWTGLATKYIVPAVSGVNCTQDVTTVFLTGSMWNLTATSVRLVCSLRTVNATVLAEEPFAFRFTNPGTVYGDTCTATFTLDIGFFQYITLTTPSFAVCVPNFPLVPISSALYPGVGELFLEFSILSSILQSSVNASGFIVQCGAKNATVTSLIALPTPKTLHLRVTNCSSATTNATVRLTSRAFATSGGNTLNTAVATPLAVYPDVAFTRRECRINAQGHSQMDLYISGEWDVARPAVQTSTCALVSQSVSDFYLTFTVNEFKYTPCTADVFLVSPGPRFWNLTLRYGACDQWDWKDGLLFGYLFAANQDKSKTVAQTQQLNYMNDAAGLGLGEMDWMTDVVKYKTDGIGIEARIPPGARRYTNAKSRGNFGRILGFDANNAVSNYTLAVWMKVKRTGNGYISGYPYPTGILTGITKGRAPPFTSDFSDFSVTTAFECDDSGESIDTQGQKFRSGLGLSVTGSIQGIGDSGLIDAFAYTSLRIRPSWRFGSIGCTCYGLVTDEGFGNRLDFVDSYEPGPNPWYDTPKGGVYFVGFDRFAESPLVLGVASMATDGTRNLVGEMLYYTRNGAKAYLPSGAENFFGFDPRNCTPPHPVWYPSTGNGICAGLDQYAKPFCAAGGNPDFDPDTQNLESQVVLFPSERPRNAINSGALSVYSVELYNRAFSRSEIDALWTRGLPNSMPVVRTTSLSTLEDQSIANVLANISAYDFDIVELGKTSQRITIQSISLVPGSRGQLVLNPLTGNYSFVPVYCTFGNAYATLEIVLSDGIDTSRPSAVTINVQHVNHPPSSSNVSAKVVMFAPTTVNLATQDCDGAAGDSVASLTLLAAPASGTIFFNGNPVLSFPFVASGSQFNYRPSDTLSPVNRQDVFARVTIPFRATDTLGAVSETAYLTFDIANNVQAGSPTPLAVVEDQDRTVPLVSGSDTQDFAVIYVLTSLPSQGQLILNSTGKAVNASQLPFVVSGTLTYSPCRHCWRNDSFQFYVQSVGTFRQSAISTYPIDIAEANDPPVIRGPTEADKLFGYTRAPSNQRLRFSVNLSDIDSDGPPSSNKNQFRLSVDMSDASPFEFSPETAQILQLDPFTQFTRGGIGEFGNMRLTVLFPKYLLPVMLANVSIECGQVGDDKFMQITLADYQGLSDTWTVPFKCLDGRELFSPEGGTTIIGTYVILAWVGLGVVGGGLILYCCVWPFYKKRLRKGAEVAHDYTQVKTGKKSTADVLSKWFGWKKSTKARHRQRNDGGDDEEKHTLL